VVFSGSATIAGVAQGDVVVLDGPVTISGQVGGDVVALHGPVRLLATAQISGGVMAGGSLVMAEGAQVAGDVRRDVGFTLAQPVAVFGALLASVAIAVSVLVVAMVLVLMAPRGAERAAGAARSAPGAATGWGLILAGGIPLVAVAAAATIVGLPLGLAVLLGIGLLWLVGQAMVTFIIGRLVVRPPKSRVAALLAGWGIGAALGLVPVLNVVWWTLGAAFGMGAIVVAAWRARAGAWVDLSAEAEAQAGRHRQGRVPRPDVAAESETVEEPTTARSADMPLAED
jgi:hypothetical protein